MLPQNTFSATATLLSMTATQGLTTYLELPVSRL
jgi:hypothetical protein